MTTEIKGTFSEFNKRSSGAVSLWQGRRYGSSFHCFLAISRDAFSHTSYGKSRHWNPLYFTQRGTLVMVMMMVMMMVIMMTAGLSYIIGMLRVYSPWWARISWCVGESFILLFSPVSHLYGVFATNDHADFHANECPEWRSGKICSALTREINLIGGAAACRK